MLIITITSSRHPPASPDIGNKMAADLTGSSRISRSRLDRDTVPTAIPMFSGSPGLVDSTLTSADINRRRKLKMAADKPEVVIYRVLGKIETRFRWLNLRCYTKTWLQSQVIRFRVCPSVKRNYFRFVSRHLVSSVSRCQTDVSWGQRILLLITLSSDVRNARTSRTI
jgi:hypothetical protein